MTIEEHEAMQVDPTCAICNKKFYICPAGHGWFCDCTGEHDCGLLSDEQLAELKKPDMRVSALRTRLENTGYKSIWQTETINHAGDRTVISSWVPKEVPAAETPKGYKFSIYEDVLLVERYEGVDGIYPGAYCGSSTYIHGVEPKLRGRNIPLDDIEEDDAHDKAAQAVEETTQSTTVLGGERESQDPPVPGTTTELFGKDRG
jgi:hypothetical protein